MPMVLVNAFSANMLPALDVNREVQVTFTRVPDEMIKEFVTTAAEDGNLISAIGHPNTAAILSDMLGTQIVAARINIELGDGEGRYKTVYLAQYRGPRLPEGATELPAGAAIEWYRVNVSSEQAAD